MTYEINGTRMAIPVLLDKAVRASERGKWMNERRWDAAKTVQSSASPQPSPGELVAPTSDIAFLREEVEKLKLERQGAEHEAKTLEAQKKIQSLQGVTQPEDPLDKELSRLIRLRQLQALESPASTPRADSLEQALRVLQLAKEVGGDKPDARLTEIILGKLVDALHPQDPVSVLERFKSLGLVSTPLPGEMSETVARLEAYKLKLLEERDHRQRQLDLQAKKEVAEQGTIDRLLQTASKAIETIADPISRAVGESMKIRANMPTPPAPPVQVVQVPPGQPPQALSEQEQVARLDMLISQAQEAKRRIQQSTLEPSPVAVSHHVDVPTSEPATDASLRYSAAAVGVGKPKPVHTHKKQGGRET